MRSFRKLNSAGFTLMEMMTAISVVGILAAIGFPAFTRTLPGLRLTDAARQVATELQYTRIRAISQSTRYQLVFAPTSYLRQQWTGALWVNDAGAGNFALPAGVTALANENPDFQPRGILTNAGMVTITLDNGAQQMFVCVTTIGRVRIQNAMCV